ncbi:MAG: FAD-binding oxidoreductase [Bacteroidetes bacterium]|nr:FAD-binding oxidoreductase [Bacteroidota bacterium]
MHQQKRNNSTVDFIIVGQGIAGSVLSLSLVKAGYSVCVINKSNLSVSSKIAAGIWNPVVFKRLTKSWLADELIPELLSFYHYWETEFHTTLIHQRHIIKPFTEEQEKNLWLKKSANENRFLDSILYEHLPIDPHYSVSSYSKVLQAGNLDVAHFIECTQLFLKEKHSYIEEEFDYHQLIVEPREIAYHDIKANQIIFCDGHLISKNPLFNWIPMKPAKGETLTIHSTHITLTQDIFNKGFFIMPLGNDLFKIGATYEWEELNDTPTEKGKAELIKKLNAVITSPYTVISHDAGVRPSVIDRRPVVGNHPDYKHIYIFNGLGTKAVMLAPYFAKQLVDQLQNNYNIDPEVAPDRFKNKA